MTATARTRRAGRRVRAARRTVAAAAAGLALGLAAGPATAGDPVFSVPEATQPGGLAMPLDAPAEGAFAAPLPDRDAAPRTPAPATAPKGPLLDLGGVSADVETDGGAPGLFATVGEGPFSTRAGVAKDLAAPGTPAAATLDTKLAAPVGERFDLRLGPRVDWTLPDPTVAGATAGGPRRSFDLETGVDVTQGLSLKARTEYGLDAADGRERARQTTDFMMRYRVGW